MPVNAIAWRAALDIASLVPLADVDTFGGTIVTEWYSLADRPVSKRIPFGDNGAAKRINICKRDKRCDIKGSAPGDGIYRHR